MIFLKTKPWIVSPSYFLLFQITNYFFYYKNYAENLFGPNYIIYFALMNLFFFFLFILFGSAIYSFDNWVVFLFPALLHLSVFLFLFSFSNMIVNQIIILLSSFLYFFVISKIVNSQYRFRFVNIGSFFSIFLFFFSMYFFVYSLGISYIIVLFFSFLYSYLIIYYKLANIEGGDFFKGFFNLLSSFLLVEVFFFTLFLPTELLFLKSAIVVVFYYFYWGLIDLYFRSSINNKNILGYFFTFISLIFFIIFYIFLREVFLS